MPRKSNVYCALYIALLNNVVLFKNKNEINLFIAFQSCFFFFSAEIYHLVDYFSFSVLFQVEDVPSFCNLDFIWTYLLHII